MIGNIIGILAIILVILLVVFFYKKQLDQVPDEEDTISVFSLTYLTEAVAKAFAETQKENLKELNLTKQELESEQRKKNELRANLREASHGDAGAKRYIKSFIKSMLQDESFGICLETVDIPIPFRNPSMMDIRTKTEIVLYLYYKSYADQGFAKLVEDYGLNEPKEISIEEEMSGEVRYNITKEDMERVYRDVMERNGPLTYSDKLEVLTQRIYEDYKGFGPVDMLFDFAIDEIEGGVNGFAQGFMEIKKENVTKNFEFSYESVYVVFKGINIKLGCMSFGSQKELVRVCRNIYKFQTPHALSRSDAHVVATMKDGSRVAVVRPPEAASWSFCVRKFNTVSVTPTLDELLPQRYNLIPITLIKWIMYSQRSTVITGGMGSGKTTLLKASVSYIPSDKNIRVYEMSSELNLQASFPLRNIVPFAETESATMQDLYDFGKKFNANVNIVGEVASANMAVIAIQSALVGSEQALFTNHSTTTDNFVTSMRDNLMTAGGYTDETAAEAVVVSAMNFDIHMGRIDGERFIERITEIVPNRDIRYPSEIEQTSAANEKDTLEFYKRSTDRRSYTTRDICVYDPETKAYKMCNTFSEELYKIICNRLSTEARETFNNDMQALYSMLSHREAVNE